MKAVAGACLLGSVSAFVAPTAFSGNAVTQRVAAKSSLQMADFKNAIGVQAPLGLFDPLGLLKDGDEEKFNKLRYIEIKHGRVAMLAVTGHLVQQNYRFPGFLSLSENIKFADLPNGLKGISSLPPVGLAQIVLFIGFLELFIMKQKEGSFPGDMNRSIQSEYWDSLSDAQKNTKRAVELNNGRAAQMGIFALITHELINGHPYVINDMLGMTYTFNGV